jgi:hypothetical protein
MHEYGWRGTVLIQSGICLQCLVFGLLLLPPTRETRATQMITVSVISDSESSICRVEDNCVHSNDEDKITDCIDNNRKMSDEKSRIDTSTAHNKTMKRSKHSCVLHNLCLKDLFKEYFDTKLLTDIRFWIYIIATIIVHLAFSVVIHMTADNAVESGMSKFEASWLASSIGELFFYY